MEGTCLSACDKHAVDDRNVRLMLKAIPKKSERLEADGIKVG